MTIVEPTGTPGVLPPSGGPSSSANAPGARAVVLLDRVWDRITAWPAAVAVLGLVALTVLRSGVHADQQDAAVWLRLVRAFPQPRSEWRTNTITGPALAKITGVASVDGWIALHVVALLAMTALVAWVIAARFPTRRARTLGAVWLALGAVPPALTQKIGSYDVYVVAGVALVVWSGRRWMAVAGGLLLGITSAEQGLIGLVCALAVAASLVEGEGLDLVERLRRIDVLPALAVGAAATVIGRAGVVIWIASQRFVVPSRVDVVGTYLGDSLDNATSAGLAGVYAYFGLAWGVVLLAAFTLPATTSRRSMLLVALVGVPAAVTVTTYDGTRVFAMVSLAGFLVLLGRVVDAVESGKVDARFACRATAAALLAAPLLPALITAPHGGAHFTFPF